jgi:hypothetical protein
MICWIQHPLRPSFRRPFRPHLLQSKRNFPSRRSTILVPKSRPPYEKLPILAKATVDMLAFLLLLGPDDNKALASTSARISYQLEQPFSPPNAMNRPVGAPT